MQLPIIMAITAMAVARPSFIAVPADQIAFVDLSNIHARGHVRVPRQTLSPPPPQLPAALYDEDYQPQARLQQDYQPIPLQEYQIPLQQDYQPIPLQQYQKQPIGLAPPPEPLNPGRERVLTLQQQPQTQETQAAPSARIIERPPDFGEYVDFGAHTGDHGAFGWYADYPINNHEDSHYRK